MIKKIVLDNFMSHSHTVIEPAEGLTALVGPNNCGKSAVVEALRAVCENTKTDFMVRHGEKEAVVTIETDDGHVVSWHRRKDSAAYVIDGVRNDRPRPEFREQLHQVLKLPKVRPSEGNEEFDVHFGQQKRPIFLLDESDARCATFFASSSDTQRLLQMQKIHRDKVADDKREERRRSGEIAKLDAKLATLIALDEIQPQIAEVASRYIRIEDEITRIDRLEQLTNRLSQTKRRVDRHSAEKQAAALLTTPPSLGNEGSIDRLITRGKGAQRRRNIAINQSAALGDLTAPPILADVGAIRMLCARRRALEIRNDRLAATCAQLASVNEPPISLETSGIHRRIETLRRSIVAHNRAVERRNLLQQITEPPPITDLTPSTDLLARLRAAESAVTRRRQSLSTATNQLAEAQHSVETWATQNPICPVCNGRIDASRLLSGLGEHAHV